MPCACRSGLRQRVCGSGRPRKHCALVVARAIELGLSFGDAEALMSHELREPPIYSGASGKARRANEDDLGLAFEWMAAFGAEAVPHDPPVTQEDVAKRLKERVVLFWETGGETVSMAVCPTWRYHLGQQHSSRQLGASRFCTGEPMAAEVEEGRFLPFENCAIGSFLKIDGIDPSLPFSEIRSDQTKPEKVTGWPNTVQHDHNVCLGDPKAETNA